MSVSFRQDRWYAVLSCLIRQPVGIAAPAGGVVGVDVGVKHLAVLSTGEMIENPRALTTAQRRLRRYQRKLDRQRRASNPDCYQPDGQPVPGKRPTRRSRNMLATERRIRRVHAKIANPRADEIHKLTHRLASQNSIVVGEDLSVVGLCRGENRGLRRLIHDASLGEIHRQLGYQDQVQRRPSGSRRPLVSVIENMLAVWGSESQTVPQRPRLSLRSVRAHVGPGRQRGPEPGSARPEDRRPEWRGDTKRKAALPRRNENPR
jgi:putative transposase